MHLLIGPVMDRGGFAVLWISFLLCSCALFLITRVSVPESCGDVKTDVSVGALWGIFVHQRLFFLNITAIGAGFAMVQGMLFLLLQELQASNLLCGISVVVTVIFELPIFHYAKFLLKTLGTRKMILLGQLAWVVRAVFYANMTSAWTVVLIEPLHGVTFALVWTAAIEHVAQPTVSGHGLEASAQGLLQVCFMGLGPMLGLFIGGLLFDHLGSHAAYGIFAVVILASGLTYARCSSDEGVGSGADDAEPKDARTIGKQAVPSEDLDNIPLELSEDVAGM